MPSRRGKLFALSTVALAVAALCVAGWAAKDWILEEWYVHQLRNSDEEVRLRAAEVLGVMMSVRAVPELIRLFRANGDEGWFSRKSERGFTIVYFTPLAHALYRVGDGSLLTLDEQVRFGGAGAHDLAVIALAIRSTGVPIVTVSYDEFLRERRGIRPISERIFPGEPRASE